MLHDETNDLGLGDIGTFDKTKIITDKIKVETRILNLEKFTTDNGTTIAEERSAQTKIINLKEQLRDLQKATERKPAETRYMDIMAVRAKLAAQAPPAYKRDWIVDEPPYKYKKGIPSWVYYVGSVVTVYASIAAIALY